MNIFVKTATADDAHYAEEISLAYVESAKQRGTGIAFRSSSYITRKMSESDAVIAFVDNKLAGFCYIETFENKKYVSNSGMIVFPQYRNLGLSKKIKLAIFKISKEKYPNSKIFSITTNNHVMKMNSELGYIPVAYSELTKDDVFWSNCQTCRNYDILTRNERKMCLCTGMLYNKTDKKNDDEK